MFRKALTIMLIGALNLQGCALSKKKPSISSQAGVTERVETRVYLRSQCLLAEEQPPPKVALFAALAAIFVPALIERGLDAVGSALKKAGSEETLRESGKFPTYFYLLKFDTATKGGKLSLNPDLGCAILVRGKFDGPDPDDQTLVNFPEPGIFLNADAEQKRVARLKASNIPVKEIVMEYESSIKIADDNTALNYESRFLEVNGFQGTRSSDTRTIVVSLTFAGVGAKEDETTLSLALVDLGEVQRGAILGPMQLRSRRSGWLGGLGATDAALKAVEKLDIKEGKTFGVMPVTFEGTLIETEKGSKALLFIADVLSSTKTDTAKALSSAILPQERQKAAQDKADALEKQREEEEDAFNAFLAAQDDLAQLKPDALQSTKDIKQFKVKSTKRIWCVKFSTLQKLGVAPADRPSCP
jgi:hypothetical protein